MTASFDPQRSAAIREALIARAAETRPRRRLLLGGALVLTGALAGAGATSAAFAASGVRASSSSHGSSSSADPAQRPLAGQIEAVEAPEGTLPGAPIIALLGRPEKSVISGDERISLRDAPEGATHVRVTIVPLTAGGLNWGTDPGGNNPSGSFTEDDIRSGNALTWYDFPLGASTDTLFLTPTAGFTARVEVQYLSYLPTRLGVNANGESYGVSDGPEGDPELTAVSGVSPAGTPVEGYVRSEMLDAFSPDHPGQPSSPEQAIAWQKEREKKYPDGWDIPVYKADGTTRIGTFHIDN